MNVGVDLFEDFDEWNSFCDEYVCEVWCGKEWGMLIIFDGEDMEKICIKLVEDSELDLFL